MLDAQKESIFLKWQLQECPKISSFQRTTIHIIWTITGVSTRSFLDTLFEKIHKMRVYMSIFVLKRVSTNERVETLVIV